MNVVELHDKVLGLLDQSRSGRVHPDMLDAAINAVHVNLLNQKIGSEGLAGNALYYPEESGRLKDALKFYYEEAVITTQSITVNLVTTLAGLSLPSLFLLLNFDVNIGSIQVPNWITPSPINRKDAYETSQNTFLKPQSRSWVTSYLTYSKGIVNLLIPPGAAISQVRAGYLRFPGVASHGIMINHSDFQADNETTIVSSPKALYSGTIYFRGQVLSIVDHTLFTEGEVYFGYLPVDIDDQLIDILVPAVAGILAASKLGVLNSGKEN